MLSVCRGFMGCRHALFTKRMPVRCSVVAHLCFFFFSLSLSRVSALSVCTGDLRCQFHLSVLLFCSLPPLSFTTCVSVPPVLSRSLFSLMPSLSLETSRPETGFPVLDWQACKRHTWRFCRPGDTLWLNFVWGASWLSLVIADMERLSKTIYIHNVMKFQLKQDILQECDEKDVTSFIPDAWSIGFN